MRSARLSGSTVTANRALLWVYSWPQHTSAAPGKAASLCSDANISAAVPSSSRPQPSENKRVAAQQNFAVRDEERDVAARVARRVDHVGDGIAERHGIAFGHRHVEPGQAMRVRLGAYHAGAVAGAYRVGAGHVVVVMVGEEDGVQPAAIGIDRGDHRIGVGGVHDAHRIGAGITQQPGIVVGEHRHGLDCYSHGHHFM